MVDVTGASAPVLWNELDGTVLDAVITVLLQVFDLADCGQHGGKAADVGLDLRGDRWPSAVRASMQAALEQARELGIARTDADAGAQP